MIQNKENNISSPFRSKYTVSDVVLGWYDQIWIMLVILELFLTNESKRFCLRVGYNKYKCTSELLTWNQMFRMLEPQKDDSKVCLEWQERQDVNMMLSSWDPWDDQNMWPY